MTDAPIGRVTLTQQVYRELKRQILSGERPQGSRLNEKELAAALGVSPTPVREALNNLRGEGLLEYSAWQGAVVTTFRAEDVRHLYSIRANLERLAVTAAGPSLSQQDLEWLEQNLRDFAEAVSAGPTATARQHQLNEEFHRFFRDRAANRWLDQIMSGLADLLVLARLPLASTSTGERSLGEHSEVVARIKAEDWAGAGAAMADHITRVQEEVAARLLEASV